MAKTNGLTLVNEIRRELRELGLSTAGKLAELEVRLEQAKAGSPEDAAQEVGSIVEPADGLIPLSDVPDQVEFLDVEGAQWEAKGKSNLELAALAEAQMAPAAVALEAFAAIGVKMEVPTQLGAAIYALTQEARRDTAHGQEMQSRSAAMAYWYGQLTDAIGQLQELGVRIPESLLNLPSLKAPELPMQRWEFKITGLASLLTIVEGRTLAEAKQAIRDELIVWGESPQSKRRKFPRSEGWCTGGFEAYMAALEEIEDEPVYSRSYNSTLTVTNVTERDAFHAAADRMGTPALRKFRFRLDGDIYEGVSIVRALNLAHAVARVLADEADEGMKLSDAEMSPAELLALKSGLGELTELRTTVSRFGHTLSFRIVEG